MSVTPQAVQYLLQNEGGFTNDPSDPGGPTKYGCTIDSCKLVFGPSVDLDFIRNLSLNEAEQVYQQLYWKPMGLDKVNDSNLQIAIFDCGVLDGINGCATIVQQSLNACGHYIIVDGYWGPKTINAINATPRADLIMAIVNLLLDRYQNKVNDNPSLQKFLTGWENRTNRLRVLI